MHQSAYDDIAKFVTKYMIAEQVTTIVDVGSRDINGATKPLFANPLWTYYGLDLEAGPNVDLVVDDPYRWSQIVSATVDVVVCTQTLEHSPQPWRVVREIARVVRPGGLIYCCVPCEMPFHEFPVDCFRVWPDGMRGLFADAGIEPIEVYMFTGEGAGCTTGIGRQRGRLQGHLQIAPPVT